MTNTTAFPPAKQSTPISEKTYIRFDISQRIEHLVFLLAFALLAVTGLPQKFAVSPLGSAMIDAFGGIEMIRQIHHISALVMMIVSIFHVVMLLYRVFVLRVPWSIVPLLEDLKHLFHDISYYFGLRKRKAHYGRYNYAEKAEYLFVVWGTVLMAITGFVMWNPIATARLLPGQFIPASKVAHGAEAILAALSIVLWHFYHVHIRHLNRSIFTGKVTRKEMEDEHPAELALIESGQHYKPPPNPVLRKRLKLFFPFALLITLVLSFSVYMFITFEETAITTIPRGEDVPIYVPITPTPKPTPTPAPTVPPGESVGADTWKGKYDAMFRNRCGTCHGITSVGGLTLATYQDALIGGDTGPAIVLGDPDASVLIQVQSIGDHPGQLTIDELNQVIEWIEAGAPEQ